MREGFESSLHAYHAAAEELHADGLAVDQETLTESDIAELVENTAAAFGSAPTAHAEILKLQDRKRDVMERLHAALARIERGEGAGASPEAAPRVTAAQDGTYAAAYNGRRLPVTLGELVTDGEWGVDYALDASMPRAAKRRYVLEMAKRELRELLNQQILHNEVGRSPHNALFRSMLDGTLDEPPGIIAEKMVRNFLKKAAIDLGMDFTIVEADVHQDTVQKIDFIIHRTDHNRGASVETGVQFTTNTQPDMQEHKRVQLDEARKRTRKTKEVDDIVLVTIPLNDTMRLLHQWNADWRPGGPDGLWSRSEKKRVLASVLAGVIPESEIAAALAKVDR